LRFCLAVTEELATLHASDGCARRLWHVLHSRHRTAVYSTGYVASVRVIAFSGRRAERRGHVRESVWAGSYLPAISCLLADDCAYDHFYRSGLSSADRAGVWPEYSGESWTQLFTRNGLCRQSRHASDPESIA